MVSSSGLRLLLLSHSLYFLVTASFRFGTKGHAAFVVLTMRSVVSHAYDGTIVIDPQSISHQYEESMQSVSTYSALESLSSSFRLVYTGFHQIQAATAENQQ